MAIETCWYSLNNLLIQHVAYLCHYYFCHYKRKIRFLKYPKADPDIIEQNLEQLVLLLSRNARLP